MIRMHCDRSSGSATVGSHWTYNSIGLPQSQTVHRRHIFCRWYVAFTFVSTPSAGTPLLSPALFSRLVPRRRGDRLVLLPPSLSTNVRPRRFPPSSFLPMLSLRLSAMLKPKPASNSSASALSTLPSSAEAAGYARFFARSPKTGVDVVPWVMTHGIVGLCLSAMMGKQTNIHPRTACRMLGRHSVGAEYQSRLLKTEGKSGVPIIDRSTKNGDGEAWLPPRSYSDRVQTVYHNGCTIVAGELTSAPRSAYCSVCLLAEDVEYSPYHVLRTSYHATTRQPNLLRVQQATDSTALWGEYSIKSRNHVVGLVQL